MPNITIVTSGVASTFGAIANGTAFHVSSDAANTVYVKSACLAADDQHAVTLSSGVINYAVNEWMPVITVVSYTSS